MINCARVERASGTCLSRTGIEDGQTTLKLTLKKMNHGPTLSEQCNESVTVLLRLGEFFDGPEPLRCEVAQERLA